MTTIRPPRLARALLLRALPADARDPVDGDLAELFARRRARDGDLAARRWYWRETLALSARFAAERSRDAVLSLFGAGRLPSVLDFRLGARMLAKQPGLTIVGGLGMAVATAIGAGGHAIVNGYLYPKLPLHEGERVVTIINYDPRLQNENARVLHHLVVWRRELRTVVDLGAFRTVRRNLIGPSGEAEPVSLAEMTASGFRVARVPPLAGRALLDADEQPGAPNVVVVGHDVWASRFDGDPQIVGRTIRLGRDVHTIVGVMPPGFGFPVSHSYWVPLRYDPAAVKPGAGPALEVFGRLAPNVTRAEAEAELAVVGRRLAAAAPAEHAGLRTFVAPYTEIFTDEEAEGGAWKFQVMQAMLSLLLVLVCLNVAVLVYARTVTRTGEIAVRTALGATRARIVAQLFAEALVLSVLAALVGLAVVAAGLQFFDRIIATATGTGRTPFWIDPGLSLGTALYALGLAVLAATIVGVLPALRATGGQLRTAMAGLSGGAKAQLGRTWTFLIVAQVAIAVAALPPALIGGGEMAAGAAQQQGFAGAAEVVAARFVVEGEGGTTGLDFVGAAPADTARSTLPALLARLATEPGVVGATLTSGTFPGGGGPARVEVDGRAEVAELRSTRVDASYFDVFGVKTAAGRVFGPGDARLAPAERPVVVNRSFVTDVLGGGEAVGRRIRYQVDGDSVRPWRAIAGVVEDFPAGFRFPEETAARVYHLVAPGEMRGGTLLVRLRGQTPAAFAPALNRVTTSVDPTLQLLSVRALDGIYVEGRRMSALAALVIALVTGCVLLLSAAGIHALMSFTVNQRRREIGIRAALGADPRRLLTSVLARATRQLAAGVAVGLALAVAVDRVSGGEVMSGDWPVVVPATAALMALVGVLAAAGPARRGLRVQPTEALRAE